MYPRIMGRAAILLLACMVFACRIPPTASAQCELDAVHGSDTERYDQFGSSVAMDGDFVVVGAAGTDRFGRDFVPAYIFRRDGSSLTQEAILAPTDISPRSNLGYSVAISGDLVVVGAPRDGHSEESLHDGRGAAYVYRFSEADWVEEAKLVPPSIAGMEHAAFGIAVAIGDNRVFCTAWRIDSEERRTRIVYVFEHDGTEWANTGLIVPSDSTELDYFGHALSADGSVIVAGAPNAGHTSSDVFDGAGAVYVFRFVGDTWIEEAKLVTPDLPDHTWFGGSVSIANDVILVGAPNADVADHDAGAA